MKSQFEIWKWVSGYEGYYKVSNCGAVKSVDKYVNGTWGNLSFRKGRILMANIGTHGYKYVTLSVDAVHTTKLIHRMVAEAFIPNADKLPQVNHKDEVKTNNRVENLEWCTSSYNMNYGTGTKRRNKSNSKYFKKVKQYNIHGDFINEYSSITEAGRLNNYNSDAIGNCCRGRSKTSYGYIWKYV